MIPDDDTDWEIDLATLHGGTRGAAHTIYGAQEGPARAVVVYSCTDIADNCGRFAVVDGPPANRLVLNPPSFVCMHEVDTAYWIEAHLIARDDEAEATMLTRPASKSTQRAVWLAMAMLLVHDHPDWSDAKIAKEVGKDKSTLSRSREYQAAAAMARGAKGERHRGHISVDPESGLRDVEAYSDDPAEHD